MTSSNATARTAREIFDHAKNVSLANIAALGRLRDQAPEEHRVLIEETLANAIDIYFAMCADEVM
jgi:hypothetical protein